MKITSLEEKRKQKDMEEMIMLPVYESIHLNKEGELIGKLVDYKKLPKYYLLDEGE